MVDRILTYIVPCNNLKIYCTESEYNSLMKETKEKHSWNCICQKPQWVTEAEWRKATEEAEATINMVNRYKF